MKKKYITNFVLTSLSISIISFQTIANNITTDKTISSDETFNERVIIGDTNKGGGSLTITNNGKVTINNKLDVGWGHRTQAEIEADMKAKEPLHHIDPSYLKIENGGTLTINKKYEALEIGGSTSESVYPGFERGFVTIDGKGSLLKIDSGDIILGISNGKGVLKITNGGKLDIINNNNPYGAPYIKLGVQGITDKYNYLYGASTGSILIDDGILNTVGSIAVGYDSKGKSDLIIKNNGIVNAEYIVAGNTLEGSGLIIVDGDGSSINSDRMTISNGGDGTLIVSNGGTVNVKGDIIINQKDNKNSSGDIYIGSNEENNPVTPGIINANSINFTGNYNNLIFNHNSNTYNFNTTLKSFVDTPEHGSVITQGSVSFLNGTTIISSDNSDFYGTFNIKKNATLSLGNQYATGNATVTNNGTLLINKEKTIQSLNNTGNIYLSDTNNTGSILTIDKDYSGSGTIVFNTKLEGDNSTTDKLVINGEATGTTDVVVNNIGGEGASTIEGIELIKTGGSTSDTFKQKDRIIAGNYEYHLQQGTTSENKNNWYLTSADTTRPESGSYIGNLQAAGTMFNTTLKDRQGGGTYINPVTGEVYTSSVWARSVGSHQKGNISDGQSDYTANKFVFQMGGDVINGSLQDNDEYHIGVMAGYGNQHNRSHNNLSGYHSKGSLWGYSAGLYGTWYQDTKTNTGLYVDSWVLYNWFNNSVHGDKLEYENYKTKGFTASIESGYAFKLGSYPSYGETTNTVYITPQAQAIWSGVKADNHKESNGTNVEGLGNNNIQTRLGVRLSIVNEGKNLETLPIRPLMPFVEANWIYTSKQYGVSMDNEKAYFEGTRNIGEVKAGLEADLSHNVTVWGNIAQQFGSHSYQNTQGMLGVKYAF